MGYVLRGQAQIELWAEEKLGWLRGYLQLPQGIPSHDTFGLIFGLIDLYFGDGCRALYPRWARRSSPSMARPAGARAGIDTTALRLASAFAAGAGLVLGQRATAEKCNGITAIPELLSTLALAGCTVTIDAMGTQTAIAEAIQERGADYVLAVKDNQPKLAESIEDFWNSFRAHPARYAPHSSTESVEKNHARIETRRCTIFDQLECLHKPQQWKGLGCFVVLESEPTIGNNS
jgi:predicted transposase YbfD/YdcC